MGDARLAVYGDVDNARSAAARFLVLLAHDAITAPRQDGPWFEGYDNVSQTIS
jgi:hypothetical protein